MMPEKEKIRKGRRFFIWFVLFLVACNHNVVRVGETIDTRRLGNLVEGKTHYGEVLAQLGPPLKVSPYGDGFLFLYGSFRADEGKLTISYGQYGMRGKFDYSGGRRNEQIIMLCFDEQGILRHSANKGGRFNPGWGVSLGPMVVGIDLIENPFFEKYDYYRGKHLPLIFSFLERSYGRYSTDPGDLKYVQERGPEEDQVVGLLSPKRGRQKPPEHGPISVQTGAESFELSRLVWREVKEEIEKGSFESLLPYTPHGFYSTDPLFEEQEEWEEKEALQEEGKSTQERRTP